MTDLKDYYIMKEKQGYTIESLVTGEYLLDDNGTMYPDTYHDAEIVLLQHLGYIS